MIPSRSLVLTLAAAAAVRAFPLSSLQTGSQLSSVPLVACEALTQQQQPIGPNNRRGRRFQPSAVFSQVSSNEQSSAEALKRSLEPLGIAAWFAALSYFIVRNYKFRPWPTFLLSYFSKRGWVLIHAVSSMLFSGGIILSTILEWRVVQSRNPDVVQFWFARVSNVDKAIVLPALTGAIVSGMAQATIDYGGMATAPIHIRSAVHILATFAIWWGLTDLTTQLSARRAVSDWYKSAKEADDKKDLPKVLHFRRWSNVVSCLFVVALYSLMALKPGYQ